MANPNPLADAVANQVFSAVEQQLDELQSPAALTVELASMEAELKQLTVLLAPLPQDAAINGAIQSNIEPAIAGVLAGSLPRSTLGKLLADLYLLDAALVTQMDIWIAAKPAQATAIDKEKGRISLRRLIEGARRVLAGRPDVAAIMEDLFAIKELRGGPADATAYHDFHVLQVAFKHVWLHAFDGGLKKAAQDLYTLLITDRIELGTDPQTLPEPADIKQVREFAAGVLSGNLEPIPQEVWGAFGTLAMDAWSRLTSDQQFAVLECAKQYLKLRMVPDSSAGFLEPPWLQAKQTGEGILVAAKSVSQSAPGRLEDLILTIDKALKEPYVFDVFAPNSYNYGLMVTYRQRWVPGPYQAGDLAATIPLAPGEVRKFTKRRVVKKTRAEKEIERSMSSHSIQSSETSRAEHEIMQRATNATNFKMTATGSFNIGIGSMGTTTEFGGNQEMFSSLTKKGFHEATLKAAEDYRQERSVEVDTTTSIETEESSSGEISNPNNEITVTYLFYELQRRYTIQEFLYRVRPVILVAQDVPLPDEIDEAWLVQYQWILARVLLDDSFRAALTYLSSGFAGDELAVEVKKANWEAQRRLVGTLETKTRAQLTMRDHLREMLVQTQLNKDLIPEMPGALKFFTFGMDPTDAATDVLEANRKAAETRLGYTETALEDAQDKLRQAASAFDAATKEYSTALQNQYNRRVAIDQLRAHVKQNILYYMQAIWDHEPVDQRFFRLYKQKVICPQEDPNCKPVVAWSAADARRRAMSSWVEVSKICAPTGGLGGDDHELVEVADLDNPVGYKGNYMIFPLKHSCALTEYMLNEFIDPDMVVRDPDGTGNFPEDFDERWKAAKGNAQAESDLRDELEAYLTAARRSSDEIIVPTGQLFIEALPGSHPLLEDFKLLHRAHDVRKVKAEVRHAELENLRLASRLAAGEREDPEIEKKIVIGPEPGLTVTDQ